MSTGLNRAMQVRTADRLRTQLARHEAIGLPIVGELSEADRRELCVMGGGRLAAVALCVDVATAAEMEVAEPAAPALVVREVARLIDEHVRKTDLLGWWSDDTLLVLAPGLDALGARSLATRLRGMLANRHFEIAGTPVELRVKVGSACRSAASPSGWTMNTLGADAQVDANQSQPAFANL